MHVTPEQYVEKSLDEVSWLSFGAGVTLVVAGFKQGSSWGSLLGAAGGALLCSSIMRSGPTAADRRPAFARGVKVRRSIVVQNSPEACYRFWRDLTNLPRFLDHLESIEILSDRRSRWVMKSAGDTRVTWDAEVIHDVPNQIIGWRSLPGSDVDTAGSIRFESEPSGTRVVITLKYNPPAGAIGAALLHLLGSAPEQQIDEDLRRFKSLMEDPATRL